MNLTGVIISSHFEGPIKELVHAYKYEGLRDLDKYLASFLFKNLLSVIPVKTGIQDSNWIITYVPIHKSKLNRRGYNQSELLAKELCSRLHLEFMPILKKARKTQPQIGLKRKERLTNLSGSFEVKSEARSALKGKNIIIIDDIVTTGATLNECAKELRKYEPREIWGLVLAKN